MIYVILFLWIIYFVGLIIFYFIKRRKAIKRVKCTSDDEKLSYVNEILEPFGFEFDIFQDIIISKNDCWQRDFGYMNLYDYKAPFFNMVVDSLPIEFKYNDKDYRIELWKGQYGITTGAEIGVYVRDKRRISKVYRSVDDDERLDMYFSLDKNCKLFSRCDRSWWLTGFDLGTFSRLRDLKMNVCITFPNQDMLNSFVNSLIDSGYSNSSVDICDNQVCFDFCCANNYKPNRKHKILKLFMQIINFINCKWYLCFTRFFNRTLDRLTYLIFMMPCLCRFIIKLSVPRRKLRRK